MFDPSKISYKEVKRHVDTSINNPEFKKFFHEAIDHAYGAKSFTLLRHALSLHSYPVNIEEFLFGHRYLSRPTDELYPAVVDSLIDINENQGRLINRLTEGVFTGGIGSAKTTTALYTNAYQLYLLSCYKNPHQMFQMDSTSEILFIFQSMNASLAKDLDFGRFKAICEQSYYFTTVFPFNKEYVSSLKFPNRIEAKPITSDGGAIGQNVIGGLIDEVNFMAVIEGSKKAQGKGTYDQAKAIYDSVSRRIKTRFVNSGGMAGILCLVSSKNYPGEFTDVKLAEAETDKTIYIYDKRVWEVKPEGTFSGNNFTIFVGDEHRKGRIMHDEEEVAPEDRHLVMQIPTEFKSQFEHDLIGSLRDIAGVSTLARYPFFQDAGAVDDAFYAKSVLSKQEHDFNDSVPLQIYPKRFKNPDQPRWVHIDLSITGDSAGVACGYVEKFVNRNMVGTAEETVSSIELVPKVALDFILRVMPPKGGEIKFFKIRDLIYALKKSGLNIKWISFDSFQSVDSVQILRQNGYSTGYVSMDTSMTPYTMVKQAMYDRRLVLPEHNHAKREFLSLERVLKKDKIDHPAHGSKDCTDAVAGVVYGLSLRREIWSLHGVSPVRMPEYIKELQDKTNSSNPKDIEDELNEQRRYSRLSR